MTMPIFYACLLVVAVGGILVMAWMMVLQYSRETRSKAMLALKVKAEASNLSEKVSSEATSLADALVSEAHKSKSARVNIDLILRLVQDMHRYLRLSGRKNQ